MSNTATAVHVPRIGDITPLRARVLDTLSDGNEYTAQELNSIHNCDSRSIIRHLRNVGYIVNDRWETNDHGARIKFYSINPKHPFDAPTLF